MKPNSKFDIKTLLFSGLTAMALVACGGGSGSGTAPPAGELDLGFGNSGSAGGTNTGGDSDANVNETPLLPPNQEVSFALDEGLCPDGFCDSEMEGRLTANLNGVEIKGLFTFEGNKAKVSAYQLQGLVGENNEKGKDSTLSIGVSGSGKSPANANFKMELAPQVVLLKSTKANTNNNAAFVPASCEGLLTHLSEEFALLCDAQSVAQRSYLNRNSEKLTINGVYRHEALNSIKQTAGTGNPSKVSANTFKVDSFKFSEGANTNKADFSLEVNSKQTAEFAVSGKILADMLAFQINEIKDGHVISQWVNGAVEAYIKDGLENENNGISEEREFPPRICQDVFSTGFDVNFSDTDKPIAESPRLCTFQVTKVQQIKRNPRNNQEEEVGLNFTSNVSFAPIESVEYFESGWSVSAKAEMPPKSQDFEEKLRVGVVVKAYTNNGWSYCRIEDGEKVGCESLASAEISLEAKPSITLNFELGKPVNGDDRLAILLDYPVADDEPTRSFEFVHGADIVNFEQCTPFDNAPAGWNCGKGKGGFKVSGFESLNDINKSLARFIKQSVKCVMPYAINNPLKKEEITECGFESGEGENPFERVGKIQAQAIKNKDDLVVSAIESQLTNVEFNAPKLQGFVTLTGWQKTVDNGVINNLVGAPFVITQSKAVKGKDLAAKAGEDIKLAISSNWLNQILLSAYQSDQLNYKIEKQRLSELGQLGEILINQPGGHIKPNDTLDADIQLDSAPYVRFVDGKIELIAHNIHFDAVLSTNTAGCVGPCVITLNDNKKPYLSLELSVQALLDININDKDQPFNISPENLMVHITKAAGTKLVMLGKTEFDASDRGMLLPPIYGFIKEQLSDVLKDKWKPMQSTNKLCMNNGIIDKFFPKDGEEVVGQRILRIKATSFDATDKGHLIVGANLTDGGIEDKTAGLELFNIILQHQNNCP